jgi:hypothetical protein
MQPEVAAKTVALHTLMGCFEESVEAVLACDPPSDRTVLTAFVVKNEDFLRLTLSLMDKIGHPEEPLLREGLNDVVRNSTDISALISSFLWLCRSRPRIEKAKTPVALEMVADLDTDDEGGEGRLSVDASAAPAREKQRSPTPPPPPPPPQQQQAPAAVSAVEQPPAEQQQLQPPPQPTQPAAETPILPAPGSSDSVHGDEFQSLAEVFGSKAPAAPVAVPSPSRPQPAAAPSLTDLAVGMGFPRGEVEECLAVGGVKDLNELIDVLGARRIEREQPPATDQPHHVSVAAVQLPPANSAPVTPVVQTGLLVPEVLPGPAGDHRAPSPAARRRGMSTAARTTETEVEEMKARFSRMLLGEDLSGGDQARTGAMTISNAITNLAAGTFGEMRRLEPLPESNVTTWNRELEWYITPTQHIVVREADWKELPGGERVEIMVSRQRRDIAETLPALLEADLAIQGILESYAERGFSYRKRDQTDAAAKGGRWWTEVPVIPEGGLADAERGKLHVHLLKLKKIMELCGRENQAAMARMTLPVSEIQRMPHNAKDILPPKLYRDLHPPAAPAAPAAAAGSSSASSASAFLNVDDFIARHGIDTPVKALEMVSLLEKVLVIWRRKASHKGSKFEMASRLIADLKARFPGMRQTELEVARINNNKDIGHAVIEALSRVLESRAATLISRILEVTEKDDEEKKRSDPLALSLEGGGGVLPLEVREMLRRPSTSAPHGLPQPGASHPPIHRDSLI